MILCEDLLKVSFYMYDICVMLCIMRRPGAQRSHTHTHARTQTRAHALPLSLSDTIWRQQHKRKSLRYVWYIHVEASVMIVLREPLIRLIRTLFVHQEYQSGPHLSNRHTRGIKLGKMLCTRKAYTRPPNPSYSSHIPVGLNCLFRNFESKIYKSDNAIR